MKTLLSFLLLFSLSLNPVLTPIASAYSSWNEAELCRVVDLESMSCLSLFETPPRIKNIPQMVDELIHISQRILAREEAIGETQSIDSLAAELAAKRSVISDQIVQKIFYEARKEDRSLYVEGIEYIGQRANEIESFRVQTLNEIPLTPTMNRELTEILYDLLLHLQIKHYRQYIYQPKIHQMGDEMVHQSWGMSLGAGGATLALFGGLCIASALRLKFSGLKKCFGATKTIGKIFKNGAAQKFFLKGNSLIHFTGALTTGSLAGLAAGHLTHEAKQAMALPAPPSPAELIELNDESMEEFHGFNQGAFEWELFWKEMSTLLAVSIPAEIVATIGVTAAVTAGATALGGKFAAVGALAGPIGLIAGFGIGLIIGYAAGNAVHDATIQAKKLELKNRLLSIRDEIKKAKSIHAVRSKALALTNAALAYAQFLNRDLAVLMREKNANIFATLEECMQGDQKEIDQLLRLYDRNDDGSSRVTEAEILAMNESERAQVRGKNDAFAKEMAQLQGQCFEDPKIQNLITQETQAFAQAIREKLKTETRGYDGDWERFRVRELLLTGNPEIEKELSPHGKQIAQLVLKGWDQCKSDVIAYYRENLGFDPDDDFCQMEYIAYLEARERAHQRELAIYFHQVGPGDSASLTLLQTSAYLRSMGDYFGSQAEMLRMTMIENDFEVLAEGSRLSPLHRAKGDGV